MWPDGQEGEKVYSKSHLVLFVHLSLFGIRECTSMFMFSMEINLYPFCQKLFIWKFFSSSHCFCRCSITLGSLLAHCTFLSWKPIKTVFSNKTPFESSDGNQCWWISTFSVQFWDDFNQKIFSGHLQRVQIYFEKFHCAQFHREMRMSLMMAQITNVKHDYFHLNSQLCHEIRTRSTNPFSANRKSRWSNLIKIIANNSYSKSSWLFVTPPAPLTKKSVRCAFF